MGLFFPEDPHFDENQRQTGFYRYRQLLFAPWTLLLRPILGAWYNSIRRLFR